MKYDHITSTVSKSTLSEARSNLGLNQEEFAEKLSVSERTVTAIESGRYDPPAPLATKIADTLGIQVEELYEK